MNIAIGGRKALVDVEKTKIIMGVLAGREKVTAISERMEDKER